MESNFETKHILSSSNKNMIFTLLYGILKLIVMCQVFYILYGIDFFIIHSLRYLNAKIITDGCKLEENTQILYI